MKIIYEKVCGSPHWPSTLRWCLFSGGMGCHTPSVQTSMVLLCWQLGAGNNVGTLSWQVSMVLVLSCLLAKWEGGRPTRVGISSASCPRPKLARNLLFCSSVCAMLGSSDGDPCFRAAGLGRWPCRCGQGVDGPTPLGDDVVWDARYVA